MKQIIFKSSDGHRLLINKRSQNKTIKPRIQVSWFLLRAWNMTDDNDNEDDDNINVIKVQKRCAILYMTI